MAISENDHTADGVATHNQSRKRSRKTSPVRWITGLVVRLCIWYALLTPFFRCPSKLSDLNESSPRVCKPYLMVRSYVEPRILPYYNTYAGPYVDITRPYVSAVNEHVYAPAANLARERFDKYGAPAWDQARAYGEEHWEAQVVPRLQLAQDSVTGIYTSNVDPYVQHVVLVASPYYKKASDAVAFTYGNYVISLYAQSSPFIGKTYTSGQEILATQVLPYAHGSWSSVVYFATSELWPKVTGLYSQNVEPQLVKIGERLASYREGKRLRASVEEVDSASEEVVSSSSAGGSHTSNVVPTTASTTQVSAQTSLSPTEQAAQSREKIASDLQLWQEKFTVAARRGIDDLGERIEGIVASHIASGAKRHGESLATALDTVVADEISTIKSRINTLAESLPYEDAPKEEASAQNELVKDVKSAAISIRDRAQAMREWHSSFDEELVKRVSAAIESTLDILDNVRDLGLQEIGMRWAWMDGVTYKDWAKYHSLKAQFDDYRSDVTQVGMQHGKLEDARNTANELMARGMEIAENTAKELAQLREVGGWKIAAREANDDFNPRSDPPPVLPKPAETASSADDEIPHEHLATSEPSSESEEHRNADEPAPTTSSVDAEVNEDELGVNDQILSTDQDSLHADAESSVSDDSAQDSAPSETFPSTRSNPIWGVAAAEIVPGQVPIHDDAPDDDYQERDPTNYISSVASSRLNEALNWASAQLALTRASVSPTPTSGQHPIVLDAQRRYYEAVGLAHDHYSAFVSSASGAAFGSPVPTPPPGTFQGLIEDARSGYSHASSLASSSLAVAMSSASAAIGPEDEGNAQGLVDDASSKYTAALSAASASLSVASASASSAIYGASTGQVELLATKVSENWESLVSKASEQVYGSQEPYTQRVLNHLAPKYEAVEELVSELLVGKEPAFTDKVIGKLHAIYETPAPAFVTDLPSVQDILDSANKQIKNAIEAASVQIYGTSKGPVEQATAAAGSAFASASNQISGAIYGKEQTYIEVAQGAIDEAYSSAGSAIRNAIYPTPTPSPVRSIVDAAYDSVASAADEQQKALESATSKLGFAVGNAQSQLSNLAHSVRSLGSEAVETATSEVETFTKSIKSAQPTKDEL